MVNRVCRDCPIPGCGAKYLVKLSNHLTDVHGLDYTERRKILQEAKLQPKIKVITYDSDEDGDDDDGCGGGGGDYYYATYQNNNTNNMIDFNSDYCVSTSKCTPKLQEVSNRRSVTRESAMNTPNKLNGNITDDLNRMCYERRKAKGILTQKKWLHFGE